MRQVIKTRSCESPRFETDNSSRPLTLMPLHECSHRRAIVHQSPGDSSYACGLAQQILGLKDSLECRVDESACASCGRLTTPTNATPNAVVASIVWTISERLMHRDGTSADTVGRAIQAQRYVLPAIVEEQGRGAYAGPQRRAKIGLVGFNTASGLGYIARDLACHDVIDRWMLVTHPEFPTLEIPNTSCQVDSAPLSPSLPGISKWLSTLDWVLLPEVTYFADLPWLAHQVGARVALIPMWEMTTPHAEWLRCIDLLICPTRHSFDMFSDWKLRFGFTWEVHYLPWPVAIDRFQFRLREKCERFLFINGTGGTRAYWHDGTRVAMRRKGLDLIIEAAALTPEVPWIVYSQKDRIPPHPKNVLVKPPPIDNADLYADGDVCVQPSRWEGLGLQLLECQAAGLPLVTTDAPPMNEYQPLRLLQASQKKWGYIHEAQPIHIPMIDPSSLAQTIRQLYRSDITQASIAARTFVEKHRRWDQAGPKLREIFDSTL